MSNMIPRGQMFWYLVGAGASVGALLGTWYMVDERVQKRLNDTAFDIAFSVITCSMKLKERICAKIYGIDFYKVTRVFWLHNDHHHAEDITPQCINMFPTVDEIRECLGLLNGGYLCIEYTINLDGMETEYRILCKDKIVFPPYNVQDIPHYKDNEILVSTLIRNDEVYDITDEVVKYAGPLGDFYGGSVKNIDLYIPIYGFIQPDDILTITRTDNIECRFTGNQFIGHTP